MGKTTETPKKKRGGRVSSIEVQRRLKNIQTWILEGMVAADVVAAAQEKWGISNTQAYHYIRQASGNWNEKHKGRTKMRRSYHIAARQKLLNGVMDDNPAMALKILQDMAQMEGLYAQKPAAPRKEAAKEERPADGTPPPTAITLSNGTVISLG